MGRFKIGLRDFYIFEWVLEYEHPRDTETQRDFSIIIFFSVSLCLCGVVISALPYPYETAKNLFINRFLPLIGCTNRKIYLGKHLCFMFALETAFIWMISSFPTFQIGSQD